MSAILAAGIFIVISAIRNIAPLGSDSILRNDGIHQYAPFLENYVTRIKEGKSLLFSWNIGGGTNQFALICYYLLSPFNLLALPFNNSNIDIAIWLIILIKTMFIAVSANYLFQKKYDDINLLSVTFSLIYTFSGFYIAFYYNTMWLDALIMLPLITLGIENIVNGKKSTLYFLSLAYAILVNFYLGYMICIYCVLYFFYLVFSKDISRNENEKADDELPIMQIMAKFGFSSLFAGLICGIVIIPVIFAVSKNLGRATFTSDEHLFNLLDFISFHLTGTKPPILETTDDTAPYVMSSILTMIALPAFFFLKNVKPNKKVATAVVIAIFYFSFAVPKMNYFWHGFSAPNGLPYRFAFIYLLFIISIALETVCNLKELPSWVFGISALVVAVALIYTKFTRFATHFSTKTVVISIAAACLYLIVLLLLKYKKIDSKISNIALCILLVVEIVVGNNAAIASAGKYTKHFALKSSLEKVNEYVDNKNEFARVEMLSKDNEICNNAAMYNYNGLSLFSSLADSEYVITQNILGNKGNYFSKYLYSSQTPIYNSLFSLNYVCDFDNLIDENNPFYEKITDIENATLYKVKYSLPIGYNAAKEIASWEGDSYQTLSVQVSLWSEISQVTNAFDLLKYDNINYVNCVEVEKDAVSQYIQDTVQEVVQNEDGHDHEHDHVQEQDTSIDSGSKTYELSKEDMSDILSAMGNLYPFKATADNFSVSFDYTAKQDGEVYAVASSGCMQTLSVIREDGNKKVIDVSEKHISDLGYFEKGEKYTLIVSNPNRAFEDFDNTLTLTDSIQMLVAEFNEEKFLEGYNQILKNGTLQVDEFDDTYIHGTVNATIDGMMMMPMPYDEGWNVYVDGEQVELYEHESHIMMFELPKGEHEIEMSYFPLGLKEGIFVSIGAVLGLVMVLLLGKVHKMKEEFVAEEEKKETDEKGKK